jgi:hypothetical protein
VQSNAAGQSAAELAHREGLPPCVETPNVKAERSATSEDRAPCADNDPGAHGAPHRLSRPLQRLVRASWRSYSQTEAIFARSAGN